MTEQTKLPRYRCHKEVSAAKITSMGNASIPGLELDEDQVVLVFGEIGGHCKVTREWVKNRHAEVGGFFVAYEDGYESWSPAEAFEAGYTRR